jgi:septal ring factor EnvC (AmiA/AmiB activator)
VQSIVDSVSTELTDIEDDYSAVKEAVNEQIQALNKRDTESNDTGLNFAEEIATIKDFQDTLDGLKKDVSSLDAESDAIEEWLGTVENQELYDRAETYNDLVSIYSRDQADAIDTLDTFFDTLQDDLSAYEKGNYKSFDTSMYKEYTQSMDDLQATMVALRSQQNKVNELGETESEE